MIFPFDTGGAPWAANFSKRPYGIIRGLGETDPCRISFFLFKSWRCEHTPSPPGPQSSLNLLSEVVMGRLIGYITKNTIYSLIVHYKKNFPIWFHFWEIWRDSLKLVGTRNYFLCIKRMSSLLYRLLTKQCWLHNREGFPRGHVNVARANHSSCAASCKDAAAKARPCSF